MTFFDWFMAIIGVMSMVTIIFCAVCKFKPAVLENEQVWKVYDFFIGYDDVEEEYGAD